MSSEREAHWVVEPDGCVRGIYTELISPHALGKLSIERASHVEPDNQGKWWIDLSPVEGPTLGPFDSRLSAIRYEVDWLIQHWLPHGS